ncbi:MAG: adenosine deaminase [Egibacteraceae bacterium]
MRDLRALPKAHLHLHLTGSMRPATAWDLAAHYGVALPPAPSWEQAVARDWSAFQRPYDAAREAIRTAADVERVVREAAEDDAADGSGWLEIQIDPTSYAPRLGGLEAALEVMLDAARKAARATGIGVGVVVAASWARSGRNAEALARLAARYVSNGVVGFGLSNDERCGRVADFAQAFRSAREAGLAGVPHGGFFAGASHVRDCVELLGARRIGHGITAARSRGVLELLATRGVVLEVCPTSYAPLGVCKTVAQVPLRQLRNAGVPVALGADDPLLFGTGLAGQYALVRDALGFGDADLAELARCSIRGSAAPDGLKAQLLAGVDAWLG